MLLQLIHAILAFIGLSTSVAIDNPSAPIVPTEAKDNVFVFGTSMNVIDRATNETKDLKIKLKIDDSPINVANEIRNEFNIDYTTSRWLLRSFEHSFARLNEKEVAKVDVTIGENKFDPISVRFGDDLALLSRSFAFFNDLDNSAADQIYNTLVEKIPQHSSIEWVNRRMAHSSQLLPQNRDISNDIMSTRRQRYIQTSKCELSVAVVTSGNLDLFANLVTKFPKTDLLCEVLVISSADYPLDYRQRMMDAFPQLTFIFKSNIEGGLAESLNMATKLAKSQYFMFLSDHWGPLGESDEHIRNALEILKGSDNIAQVGLGVSEQKSGWKRVVNDKIEIVHSEFGSIAHTDSSQWPGFVLSPAIWDLNVLSKGTDLEFVDDESVFAFKVLDSGLITVDLNSMNWKLVA